ncbi:hypothetical protein OGATHE_005036 [Ogataea polymorpha]|uniref:Uncharacterized protein n=1 Tax=Ogataea polymorpha TaxID=460523 RepID=A0A9P8NX55_9ASCO|nr:hypothetical protein OGATHE_005036 [Ogataea polymorpha]
MSSNLLMDGLLGERAGISGSLAGCGAAEICSSDDLWNPSVGLSLCAIVWPMSCVVFEVAVSLSWNVRSALASVTKDSSAFSVVPECSFASRFSVKPPVYPSTKATSS